MKPRYFFPAMFFLLLVAYPLSVGPAARIHYATNPNGPPSAAFSAFYAPLNWTRRQWPSLDRALWWYTFQWIPIKFDAASVFEQPTGNEDTTLRRLRNHVKA